MPRIIDIHGPAIAMRHKSRRAIYCLPYRSRAIYRPFTIGATAPIDIIDPFFTLSLEFNLMRRLLFPFVAIMALVSISACGSKNGPTTVDSITIMKDDGSGKPGETVESIKGSDHAFHAKVALDVGTEKKISTELIAVETSQGKNVSVLSKDYELGGIENTITLDYSLPQDWPAGTYRIDVSAGGKILKSKEFKVE
jgi:hypothetical protein